jgi:hypothetical protein
VTNAASAVVASGGTGYNNNDILEVLGGTTTLPAQFKVLTCTGGGVVATVALHRAGEYTVQPSNPVATAGISTPGSDCSLTVTWSPLPQPEFCGVANVLNQSTYMRMQYVYRGLLDSTPRPHSVGAAVYLVFAGAGLLETVFPAGNNVDVKIRPASRDAEVAEGSAVTIPVALDRRTERPYPATELRVNTVRFQATGNIDTLKSGGTTNDDKGILIDFRRRDFRNYDEVQSVFADAEDIIADFPAANSTQSWCHLFQSPSGTTIQTQGWATGRSYFFSRTKILRENAGARPTGLRAEVDTRHTYNGLSRDAREKLGHTFATAASEIDSWTNMGVLATNVVSASYTAPSNGTYNFSIGPNLPSGALEARINGGTWTSVISSGNRTGTLGGVVAADTIEVRCTYAGPGTGETFLAIDAPSSATDAYAVLIL